MGVLKLFASMCQIFVSGSMWFLDSCECRLNQIGSDGEACGAESLACNGAQPKRKKLLVEIKVLPDNNFEFVSETTDCGNEKTWFPIRRIMNKMAFYALKSIHLGKHILTSISPKSALSSSQKVMSWSPLGWTMQRLASYALKAINMGRNLLTNLDGQISSYLEYCESSADPVSSGPDSGRKMISPRKRLPQSKVNIVRRCMAKLFCSQPEGVIFDPIEGFDDSTKNNTVKLAGEDHSPKKAKLDEETTSSSASEDTSNKDEEVSKEKTDDSSKDNSDDNKSPNESNEETEKTEQAVVPPPQEKQKDSTSSSSSSSEEEGEEEGEEVKEEVEDKATRSRLLDLD